MEGPNQSGSPIEADVGRLVEEIDRSRIVVNIPALGGLNMRTFEALASGALLLTKRVRNGQDRMFKEGAHLATYRDGEDLMRKVEYYLRHDREREEIAREGRREVLACHTYDHRADRMLEVVGAAVRARAVSAHARAEALAAFYDKGLNRLDLMLKLAGSRGVPATTRLRLITRAALKAARRRFRPLPHERPSPRRSNADAAR